MLKNFQLYSWNKSAVSPPQLLPSKVLIILFYLILKSSKTFSAAQSCVPCDNEKLKNRDKVFEEYVFEHQVTKQGAIKALNQLNDSYYEGSTDPACKAISCSPKIMKYCLSAQFLNDHCWCEQGHGKEGLPFVPHTCYVGEQQYSVSVGSCYFYTEVKECCCIRALAKRWKYLSTSPKTQANNNFIFIIIPFFQFSYWKSYFRRFL